MPFDVANISSVPTSYLSGSFRNLFDPFNFDHSRYISPVLFDETLQFELRNSEFVSAVQKLLFSGEIEETTVLSQPLVEFLNRVLTEKNIHIKKEMNKKSGYLKRLFSEESWGEWFNDRTALGNVVSLYVDYLNSTTTLDVFLKHLDTSIVKKANQEAVDFFIKNDDSYTEGFESPGRGLWDRFKDILSNIDKKISSLIFPQGVSAEKTNPNMGTNSEKCQGTQENVAVPAGFYNNLDKNQINRHLEIQEKNSELHEINMEHNIEHANKQLAEVKKLRIEETRRRRHKDARELLKIYQKTYDEQYAKYDSDKKKYTARLGYYLAEDKAVPPTLCENHFLEGEDSPECLPSFTVTPGYLRWSIFKDIKFGADFFIKDGHFNYDKGNNKPVYPECSNQVSCRSE